VAKQGLLFVKPQPLPKHPVTATVTTAVTSHSSSSSSSSHTGAASHAAAAYDDVPTVPELDEEGWVSQVCACLAGIGALLHVVGAGNVCFELIGHSMFGGATV
jgi:hypothetical protein